MKVKKAVIVVTLSLTLGFLAYISVQSFWADIHYRRAQRLAQEINWQEAALEFEKAISISPGNADYHREIGQIYSDLARIYGKEKWFNEAITHFQKAYQLNPYDAWAHYYLAWAYGNKKMFEQALAESEEAIRLDPNNATYHWQLASLYTRTEDFEKAKKEYEKVLRIMPGHSQAKQAIEKIQAKK